MPRTTPVPKPDPLLTAEELAAELRIPLGTIYQWRTRKQGPQSFKIGRHVRYRRSEINRWLAEQGDTALQSAAR